MTLVDGTWQSTSGATFESLDPANGESLGSVPDCSAQDAEQAVAAIAEAFRTWSATTAYERSAILHKAWSLMLERREELAQLMVREQGKPLRMARTEVAYAADFLLWFAEEAKRTYGETIPSSRPNHRFLVLKQPVGVAAAITPWNYPISMLTRKIGPALAAGCTIVVKPAEQTPLCAVATVKVLHDAGVPEGVVALVPSQDPVEVGRVLTTDERVRKVSFTGSTEVGRLIATQCAPGLKRVSMELGGHAPFIVLPDADPVHAAKGAAALKSLNTGQACICENRILVHESQAEVFTQTLAGRLRKMKAGHGLTEGVSVGPLIDQQAIDKMQAQVDDALERGATSDVGDVVEMANDTEYGLASYLYTNDLSAAVRIAEQLQFGMVGINDINPTSAAVPFGGIKQSGLGREGAREGLEEYLDTKVIGLGI